MDVGNVTEGWRFERCGALRVGLDCQYAKKAWQDLLAGIFGDRPQKMVENRGELWVYVAITVFGLEFVRIDAEDGLSSMRTKFPL